MKKAITFILILFFSLTLFSCGISKNCDAKEAKEVTFTLKEKKEIVKQEIVKKQRTIIATP